MTVRSAAILLACCTALRAEVSVSPLLGDHMVLQQELAPALWGKAAPGEAVTVRAAGQVKQAAADAEGRWRVTLEPLRAADHPEPINVTIEGAANTVVLRDVAVGEVWLCSGQSNMAWPVKSSAHADAEIAAADRPMLRLAIVQESAGQDVRAEPRLRLGWSRCTGETVAGFSAVGYCFGRSLHDRLDVPVGLVQAAVNGTAVEAWTSMPALEATAEARPILDRFAAAMQVYPTAIAQWNESIAAYREAYAKAKDAGEDVSRVPYPKRPMGPADDDSPAAMFNHMIAPLPPLALRGALWYQGEANVARAEQYRALLPAMIADWRARFARPDMPFGIVQLANISVSVPYVYPNGWPELREAQDTTARNDPHAGLICTIDVGEPNDIHPKNKQAVGDRAARWAAARVYGCDAVYSGPRFRSATFGGGAARISFDHVGGGLAARGGGELIGFNLAGEDRKFAVAQATIDADAVVVRCEAVPQPVAVRYGWAPNPTGNLINGADLPAVPFRTDDWPLTTAGAR